MNRSRFSHRTSHRTSHLARLALVLPFLVALSACCGSAPPPMKGTIPAGTPPPDYEAPRGYDPAETKPAATAAPVAPPAAAPAPAPTN